MTKVFAAEKYTYGSDFMREFDTLDELKRGIVEHELFFEMYDEVTRETNYTDDMYTEELFKEHSKGYKLFEIDLHDDEKLCWSEYDGQSYFSIEKKKPQVLSKRKEISK